MEKTRRAVFFLIFPNSKVLNPAFVIRQLLFPMVLIRNPKYEIRNRYPCLKRQFCFKNYSETVLHCHFYYDIQTLSLQRAEILLNYHLFMYRIDLVRKAA